MSMTKQIIVTISPDGAIKLDAQGYKGKSCADATKFLEKLMSGSKSTKKPEFYQETVGTQKVGQ